VWDIPPKWIDPKNEKDCAALRKVVSGVQVPKFVPKDNKKIETDTEVKKEDVVMEVQPLDEKELEETVKGLEGLVKQRQKYRMKADDFEKDDDSNYHIDFITSCSNLRAMSYRIPPVDRLKTKQIAGRIMPAIATTTGSVSGLVAVELLKIVQSCELEKHRNAFMNLGLPLFSFAEPFPCETTKITKDVEITIWDKWDIRDGTMRLQEFVDHFKKKYNLEVTGVFQGVQMIYVPIMPGHNKRLNRMVCKLIEIEKGAKYVDLIVTFENEDGEDVHGPPVRFWLVKPRRKRKSNNKKE